MNTQDTKPEPTEEELFCEWRELFTVYRGGRITPAQRGRFRELTGQLKKLGFFQQPARNGQTE